MSIMSKLREATWPRHVELEALPFVKALIDHSLPLESYLNQLRAMAIIHGVFESEITMSNDPRVRAVWSPERVKLPLLLADEAFFRGHLVADCAGATEAALVMTAAIRRRREANPVSLLGMLYVLEGTTLGNRTHTPDVVAALNLNGVDGCRYYASYQDQVRSRWNEFAVTMNLALADATWHEAVIAAAVEAFNGLGDIYDALFPIHRFETSMHITRVNPEAGRHPIPRDESEIQAALRAGARGWAEFPYYQDRYVARGRRFADSDTCWLATLARLEEPVLQAQIDWLSRLLSNRGMPTVLLETTLQYLHQELCEAIPENRAIYDKLLAAADNLTQSRTGRFPEKVMATLIREFDQAAGPALSAKYRHAARLLISAVADERNGVEGAVPAILKWATDPNRFPEEWIEAVHRLISQARQCVR